MDDKIGSVQIGKYADFVIVEENPLKNLKTLYGTGAIRLNENNEVVRVGGVKYTDYSIKEMNDNCLDYFCVATKV